jgi:ribosomal-protein-alanine N-acetyltransferase
MAPTVLNLKNCAQAACLHQSAFYKGWTEKDFQDFLQEPLVFGLKIQKDNTLCGYILWREVGHEAEILTLVIAPPFQRMGLGTHLFSALFNQLKAKEIEKLFLEVAEDNQSAQSFYKKQGFTFLSTRPNYYQRPENRFVSGLNFFKIIT